MTVFFVYPHLRDGKIMGMSLPAKAKDNNVSINQDDINLNPQLTRFFSFPHFWHIKSNSQIDIKDV